LGRGQRQDLRLRIAQLRKPGEIYKRPIADNSTSSREKPDTGKSTGFFMAAVEVFMDSAGFLALWDASDEHHAAAARLQQELAGKRRRFVTSEYVVDETVTLLLIRHRAVLRKL
jgi:hypothetical protein